MVSLTVGSNQYYVTYHTQRHFFFISVRVFSEIMISKEQHIGESFI
jgi:hypothetical protein